MRVLLVGSRSAFTGSEQRYGGQVEPDGNGLFDLVKRIRQAVALVSKLARSVSFVFDVI